MNIAIIHNIYIYIYIYMYYILYHYIDYFKKMTRRMATGMNNFYLAVCKIISYVVKLTSLVAKSIRVVRPRHGILSFYIGLLYQLLYDMDPSGKALFCLSVYLYCTKIIYIYIYNKYLKGGGNLEYFAQFLFSRGRLLTH
ncbi:MAG: hypothetical protein ACI8RD_010433 [Bacillariaceae sp.]|jgi:hypothetical protein